MLSLTAIVLGAAITSVPVCHVPTPEQTRAQVLALNEAYIHAVRQGDESWFEAYLSEDVLVVLGSAKRLSKRDFIAALGGTSPFSSLSLRDARVRVFGGVAQADADAPWTMTDGRSGTSRYIDTYAWIDCRWQVISAQITMLPPEEHAAALGGIDSGEH